MWDEELADLETGSTSWRDVLRWLNPRTLARRHQLGIVAYIGLFLLPTQLYAVTVAPITELFYLAIFVLSWDFVSGYTGQLSLGHPFFFALGGYTTAILNSQHGVDPVISIPIGVLMAGIGGVLVGLPAMRLRGPYLSLITLIVPLIMAQVFILWNESLIISIGSLTVPIAPGGFGGASGLDTAPQPLISTQHSSIIVMDSFQLSVLANYYFALISMTLILAVLYAITRSDTGDVFTAIREDESVVAAVGINPLKFKLFSFVVSGLAGGLGGALFVHSPGGYPQPSAILSLDLTIDVIVMSILGGMGTLVGPIIGVLFYWVVEEMVLRSDVVVPVLDVTVRELQPIPIVLVTIFVIFYMPGGILRKSIEYGRRLEGVFSDRERVPPGRSELTPLIRILRKYGEEIRKLLR